MSQSDSFIDEVTEEVRRDRLFGLMRRYGWIAILLVVLIVAGAAWNEYRKAQERASAQALGDSLLNALNQGEPAERIAALKAAPAESAGQRAVIAMLAASEAAAAGDKAAAADQLTEVADTAELPGIYRDLARFKALGLRAGEMEPAARREGYQALAVPGSALRLLAEEQIALTLIEEGDTEAALAALERIAADAEVTSGLRQRVTQLMVALGKDPTAEATSAEGSE